jgi:hypothetical protein
MTSCAAPQKSVARSRSGFRIVLCSRLARVSHGESDKPVPTAPIQYFDVADIDKASAWRARG